MKYILFLVTIFWLQLSFSQEIKGIVLDDKTKEPIETASIYFDNTTIGATSDQNGEFSIPYRPSINSPLIISYLGYETIVLSELNPKLLYKVYLTPDALQLDEVIINPDDDWTRSEKLKEFRKHFLGESENGKASTIANEDDIRLYYSIKNKQLRAVAKSPIVVLNPNLKYKIRINLSEFNVSYSYVSKNKTQKNANAVYYAGSNFFESMEQVPVQNTLVLRDQAYKGSVLHFMRSIRENRIKENGYEVFKRGVLVNPKKHIRVYAIEGSNDILVRIKGILSVSYNRASNSTIQSFVTKFKIDQYGNHTPIDKVRFGGEFGNQRIADALPLDYIPSN